MQYLKVRICQIMNKVVSCTYCVNTVLFISSFPVSCEGLPGFSLIWPRMLRQTCSWMSRTKKTATRVGNTRIRANLCECLCECGRGPTNLAANLANSANLAANVDVATNSYEYLRMCARLQMFTNVRYFANVVNFANICDKKASADVWRRLCLSVCLRA